MADSDNAIGWPTNIRNQGTKPWPGFVGHPSTGPCTDGVSMYLLLLVVINKAQINIHNDKKECITVILKCQQAA